MLDHSLFAHKIAACAVQVDVLELSVLRVLTARAPATAAEASSLKFFFATETPGKSPSYLLSWRRAGSSNACR
jgi:hypothetical protein